MKQTFVIEDAKKAAEALNISNAELLNYAYAALAWGMNVELEHGRINSKTDVTGDDPIQTAKIALAHFHETPRYYLRLAEMEGKEECEKQHFTRNPSGGLRV